uniref:Uncharacterized protein n=1 Tax=Rhizophora mucronata TaxID=61149 RepID=A0A2P2Q8E4_RHIMU
MIKHMLPRCQLPELRRTIKSRYIKAKQMQMIKEHSIVGHSTCNFSIVVN